jgi:hypothetical protein
MMKLEPNSHYAKHFPHSSEDIFALIYLYEKNGRKAATYTRPDAKAAYWIDAATGADSRKYDKERRAAAKKESAEARKQGGSWH